MRRRGAFAGLALALAAPTLAASPQTTAAKPGPTVPLTILAGGKPVRFQVEQAVTPAQQERGLMFRKSMAADHGMIFPMTPPRPASFWMKNTFIPLDILFISADHRVLQIAADAKPRSLDTIDCYSPVAAVLELGGGVAAARHIKPGDKVRW